MNIKMKIRNLSDLWDLLDADGNYLPKKLIRNYEGVSWGDSWKQILESQANANTQDSNKEVSQVKKYLKKLRFSMQNMKRTPESL